MDFLSVMFISILGILAVLSLSGFSLLSHLGGWSPLWEGSQKNKEFIGHSQIFCARFTPAHVSDKANFRIKTFGFLWVTIPQLKVLPGYKYVLAQVLCIPLLGMLTR